MKKFFKGSTELLIRNVVFGIEDSLVSTVGLLSGIAVGGVPRGTIILTGLVLIFVEAFAMGIGSFLSEETAEEYGNESGNIAKRSLGGSLVMFFSYALAGFIPLSPYLFGAIESPIVISIILSLITLFFLGFASGRISKIHPVRFGVKMLLLGGIAIAVGVLIGSWGGTEIL